MKSFTILFLIAIFFNTSLCTSYANQSSEVLSLSADEIATLKVPNSNTEILSVINQKNENEIEDSLYFYPEEDLGTSKAEKAFYKFVNDKVVNNKLNLYSMQLGEEHGTK